MRSMDCAAELVCSVANTKCPVSAAVKVVAMVRSHASHPQK